MSLPYTEFNSDYSVPLTCCQRACPIGTDVSNYIAFIAEGRYGEALEIVREENPFPSICGRVCDHECETHCRRGESDGPVAIRTLKRFIADYERSGTVHWPEKIVTTQKEKVAIIGSGPAGLTAASDLVRRGFAVKVFEALPKAGGMMRVGIPDYRLPPEILDFDLEYLLKLGVTIELNKALGKDFTLNGLKKEGYKAILLATGAHGTSKLKIKGADLTGVGSGIELLRAVSLGNDVKIGKRVVVIGGGDVAMDTARTALRLGAEHVDIFCLESREQMPAHEWETKEAIDEQIRFNCSWGPVEFIGDENIRQVRFVKCTSVFDSEGKFAPAFDESNSTTVEVDTLLIAIGQFAEFSHLPQDNIETTSRRLYEVNTSTLETTAEGVFAAGDATIGTATVVKAIASGHKAATSISQYLLGQPVNGNWQPRQHAERVERTEILPGWEELAPVEEPELSAEDRINSFSQVKLNILEAAAIAEATRCMRCDSATNSYTYTRDKREMIYHLSRDIRKDESKCLDFLKYKLIENQNLQHQSEHVATLNDLLFLPANLTRLVIDPYREACKTNTIIGTENSVPLKTAGPVIIGGLAFADLNESELAALCEGAKQADIAIRVPSTIKLPVKDLKIIRVISFDDEPESVTDACAIEIAPTQSMSFDDESLAVTIQKYRKAFPEIPIGLTIWNNNIRQNIQAATEAGFDFVTLMAIGQPDKLADFVELEGNPDIHILTKTIEVLRQIKQEEAIDILYFGGIRGGADLAKILALCGSSVIIGQAALIAAGECNSHADISEGTQGVTNFILSMLLEASMLARSCGKTDVHNLEPEDLRSLSIETSRATSIPLVGKDKVYTYEND